MPRVDKELNRKYQEKWRAENSDKQRAISFRSQLKRRGITEQQFFEMLDAQDYACAICHTHMEHLDRRLAIDHDEETGVIRGLLCASCNMGIGMLAHRATWLENAAAYLDRFHTRPEVAWEQRYL